MQNVSQSSSASTRADFSGQSGVAGDNGTKTKDFLSLLDAASNASGQPEPAPAEKPQPAIPPAEVLPAKWKAANGKQTGKTLPGALPGDAKFASSKTLLAEIADEATDKADADIAPEGVAESSSTRSGDEPIAIATLLALTPSLSPEIADTGASSIPHRSTRTVAPPTVVPIATTQTVPVQTPDTQAQMDAAMNQFAAPQAEKAAQQPIARPVTEQVAALRLAPVEVIAATPVTTEATLRAMSQVAGETSPVIQTTAVAAVKATSQDTASGDDSSAPAPQPAAAALADAPAATTLASIEAPMTAATVDTSATTRTANVTSVSAPAANAAQAPHDFSTLVDRLVEAREAAQPNLIRTTLNHSEFGTVSLQFRQDQTHMNVTLAAADPGLAQAVHAAAAASLASGAGSDDGAAPRQDNQQAQNQQQQQQAGTATTSQGQQQQSQARAEASQRASQREQAARSTADTDGKPQPAPSARRSGIFA